MDDLTKQDALELEVANFGPIVEAKINLRPLTVFVGPSNTGKSYLAILIYALHRFFSGFRGYRMFRDGEVRQLPQKTIDVIDEWVQEVQQTFGNKKVEWHVVLPDLVVDEIRSLFNDQGGQLSNEVGRCFGIDKTSALVRKGYSNGTCIVFRSRYPHDSTPFEYELMVGTQEAEFRITIPEKAPIWIDRREAYASIKRLDRIREDMILSGSRDDGRSFFFWRLIEALIDPALPQLAGHLYRPAFYLPADRTGVMHSHQVVVSALFQNATTAGLRPAVGTPMLSGVLADFLQQLIAIDPTRYQRHRSRRDLGTQIEESILGGSVGVHKSETIGYPHFTYQPKGWKTPLLLMNTSSMVSEIAPVVLYLRYMVSPGNVLIIEEPESHLHPAMQVEFTRQIAALVNAGVRVIVTTHSEWVLEELANIVQRSKLPKARRKGTPGGDCALRPDQVGAWLFKQKLRPKGSVVEEVKLDAETGLYPTDYDAVSAALYNESVSILNRIEDSGAE